ncbi:hypothetical protein AN959_14285 [Psychrobacillus sp. FJAT-21963]|nr:hypothetical protein AN959_14285 [Psychrobacillus sp. FJAT-21963]
MALSVVVASIAAYESIRLLFLLVLIVFWLLYKGKHILFIVLVVVFGSSSYMYFIFSIPEPSENVTVNKITWTDSYRINGSYLRGFAIGDDQQKWYVQLKIKSEQQKNVFLNESIAGKSFLIESQEILKAPLSHMYAFDMEAYIKSNGAVGQIEVQKYQLVGNEKSFVSFMAEKRFDMKQHIQSTFPSSLQSEAEALLIGSREQMPTDLQVAYQTLGITHLFAISGLHVALITLILYELLIRIGVRKESASWLLILVLPIYALLAGGAPSVWRSVSVTEIVLLSMAYRNKIAMEDAFSLSIIGFVFISPWIVYQIGFQLSYLAAFSLIYSSVLLNSSSSYLKQSFMITSVCQLIVYPILLYHFYEVSISSFLANLLFVPLFSFLILPINIFLLFLTYLSTSISGFMFSMYEPIRVKLETFILYIGHLPFQLWNPMKPLLPIVFFAYLTVFFFFVCLEKRKRIIIGTITLLIPIVFMHIKPYLNSSTWISFLNVGQGDCIIIEMPYRKEVIMIDTGGLLRFEQDSWKETNEKYEVGRQIVVPFLKGRGITKIDTLVITHADADHMEGAEEVLEEIKIEQVHITPDSTQKEVMKDLIKEIRKQNILVLEKIAGDHIESKYFQLQYIYPFDNMYEGNNDSLVLSMKNAYFHGLFMGDLEKEGEEELITSYASAIKQLTLLKLGHHGSKTSSIESFLELTEPDISIISAGYNNRYGHPHPEVVERLNRLNLPYLQTGKDGTIQVEIKKNGDIMISTP